MDWENLPTGAPLTEDDLNILESFSIKVKNRTQEIKQLKRELEHAYKGTKSEVLKSKQLDLAERELKAYLNVILYELKRLSV